MIQPKVKSAFDRNFVNEIVNHLPLGGLSIMDSREEPRSYMLTLILLAGLGAK